MKAVFVIISCGQGKIWHKHPHCDPMPARDAYTGAPFKGNREYADRFAEEWVILSAKYGFLRPDFVIPRRYNATLHAATPCLRSRRPTPHLQPTG